MIRPRLAALALLVPLVAAASACRPPGTPPGKWAPSPAAASSPAPERPAKEVIPEPEYCPPPVDPGAALVYSIEVVVDRSTGQVTVTPYGVTGPIRGVATIVIRK